MAHNDAYNDYTIWRSEGRQPGARRQKLAGFVKAANELRQSYFSADGSQDHHHGPEDGPGAFPEAAVVRSGNEEMILFPSYGRKHVKSKPTEAATPGREISQEEFWRREWDKHADVNAIVDVDVRGWIYTPPRGQNTRKQRLLIGLARQLSGIPAPTMNRPGDSAPSSASPSRASSPTRQEDEDLIALEADKIVRKGQREERYASRGAFSERPGQQQDTESIHSNNDADRGRQSSYAASTYSQENDPNMITPVQKRSSWAAPAKMSSAELATANAHLMTRLKPFMANPLANTPISAFFYNEQASRQQTVYTDASGHFTFKAALDFIPTHVRVLAGEKLSATEEVHITSQHGVSLISDIDDTIKHSAISAGAREIFRNAFIRDLGDLTIEGVREWYNTLHDMGVKIHYVSNSPWQMYPILTSFFKMAHLPKGSFHLKQYSGMLQGIFEPVAERKKSSLDKIMRDFPDRKFILVGDSGEADLEVYTETALDNPGRVLGIFIRDVTTTARTGYFDPNTSPNSGGRHSRNHSRHMSGDSLAMSKRLSRPDNIRDDDADLKRAISASLADMEQEAQRARRAINPDAVRADTLHERRRDKVVKPDLPVRRATSNQILGERIAASPEEDLIDFSDPPQSKPWLEAPLRKMTPPKEGQKPSPSPPPPPKPASLKSKSSESPKEIASESTVKPTPPRPRKSSTAIKTTNLPQIQTHHPSPLSQMTRQDSTRKVPPPLPARPRTYKEFAKETIAKALPPAAGYWQGDASSRPRTSGPGSARSQPTSPLARPMTSAKSFEDLNLPMSAINHPPAPPQPRRNISSYSFTQARAQSSNRRSGAWDDDPTVSPGEGLSKKEALWKQRWERARNALERNGVTLRTWRVGVDVADICVRLVETELRRIEREEKEGRNSSR